MMKRFITWRHVARDTDAMRMHAIRMTARCAVGIADGSNDKAGFWHDTHGERGGTRTLDPMIKSHVLYHLSYALTCPAV
jgi:hypothetical protein